MAKKNHELRIKLSQEEHDKLKKTCEEIGMTLSGYVRYLLLHSKIEIALAE